MQQNRQQIRQQPGVTNVSQQQQQQQQFASAAARSQQLANTSSTVPRNQQLAAANWSSFSGEGRCLLKHKT